MRFAIYSRKSVLTDRGESVENQVELCRRCLAAQYPDVGPEEIAVYEDEGFSGRDLQRPQFRRMLEDIRRERPEALVEEWLRAANLPVVRVDGTRPPAENAAWLARQMEC